jgi:hypothetical protein
LELCSVAKSSQDKGNVAREVDAFINEDLAQLELALASKELEIAVAAEGMKHLQHCQEHLQDQIQVSGTCVGHWVHNVFGVLQSYSH